MTPREPTRVEEDLQRFPATVDALMLRVERTLVALALTFDAQAAAWQRLNGQPRDDDYLNNMMADWQTAAELYRHLARTLPKPYGNHYG